MIVTAIRTRRVSAAEMSLTDLLDESIERLEPGTIVGITSKVVSLCENRVVDPARVDKSELIESEADRYLPASSSRYHVFLTIKQNTLIPSAGIDESNTGGTYVLWPEDPQRSANAMWKHLVMRHETTELGVIITDSTTSPLRMGVGGIPIAHAGFRAVNDFVGTDDLFGRPLVMTRSNVAAAEQTPIALIRDVSFVEFQRRVPTAEELSELVIDPADDLYAPVLGCAPWQRGRGR
ncbi:MAG: coenzyme F420-0:L-glutamate ligase [Spirochaetota bacterium]